MTREFKIGDKVEVITVYDECPVGLKGEVIKITASSSLGIKFDFTSSNPNFHDCDGLCEFGYGYFIDNTHLRHLKIFTKSHLNLKIKNILNEIKSNKEYLSCFRSVKGAEREINSWDEGKIMDYKLDGGSDD